MSAHFLTVMHAQDVDAKRKVAMAGQALGKGPAAYAEHCLYACFKGFNSHSSFPSAAHGAFTTSSFLQSIFRIEVFCARPRSSRANPSVNLRGRRCKVRVPSGQERGRGEHQPKSERDKIEPDIKRIATHHIRERATRGGSSIDDWKQEKEKGCDA